MHITNITDDYNDTMSINDKCTNCENNIEIIIPLLTIIPCGMSLICLISLMVYTLLRPLFNKKLPTIIIIFILNIHIWKHVIIKYQSLHFIIIIKYALINDEKLLYPHHPVRCIITGPSECGKSVFLTNLILNNTNEYDKIHIFSPSLHQQLYQKLIKCFSNYSPINILSNILKAADIDIVIDEVVTKKDFQKSDTEIET